LKKLLLLLISVILLVSTTACTIKMPSGTDESSSNTKQGSSKSETSSEKSSSDNSEESSAVATGAKVSVTVPDGWNPIEGTYVEAQYMKNTASFMIIKETFGTGSLDEVVATAKDALSTAFDNVEYIGDTEDVTISGKDAKKFTFTCKVASLEMKYIYIYLQAGGETYSVVFGDLETTFDNLLADYESIQKNIVFA